MITDTAIRKALRSAKDCQLSEGAGRNKGRLILRIKGTTATWYVQQWSGKRTFKKIGSYPDLSLDEAREAFNTHGRDIRIGEQIKPIAHRQQGTIEQLVADYLHSLEGRASHYVASQELGRFVAYVGAHKVANTIRTVDVIDFLRPIYGRGAKSMADHIRAYIKAAFQFVIENENDYRQAVTMRYGIRSNPADNIRPEPRTVGNRWLAPDELRAFWNWLHSDAVKTTTPRYIEAIKLHILTGQRMVEIVAINKQSINQLFQIIEWDKTKIGNAHAIPLPRQGWDILNRLKPNANGLFFGAVEDDTKTVDPHILSEIRERYLKATGAKWFTSRDIRRTWKTLAGFAKISKSDRDLIQNHAKGDVSGRHYDRYDYLDEKRAAMERWSQWFEENIENEPLDKVVEMKKPLY